MTFLSLKVIIDLDIEVYHKWQKKNRDYKTPLTAINGVFSFLNYKISFNNSIADSSLLF
nr:MAG TPA: hypothetical protein [Caudoviricetes sp.]